MRLSNINMKKLIVVQMVSKGIGYTDKKLRHLYEGKCLFCAVLRVYGIYLRAALSRMG